MAATRAFRNSSLFTMALLYALTWIGPLSTGALGLLVESMIVKVKIAVAQDAVGLAVEKLRPHADAMNGKN